VGFGTEILFMLVLGLLLLGPKRLPTILGHVARAKTQFENATRSFKSQLQAELEGQHENGEADLSREPVGNQ
jgi:Sec-independent protein translocase protein TatA